MGFLDISGPVLANTLYAGDDFSKPVAESVKVELPGLNFITIEYNNGNKIVAVLPQVEELETKITKVGMDNGLFALLKPNKIKMELRIAAQSLKMSGDTKVGSIRVYITGTPKSGIGGTVEPGTSWEGDISLTVYRYEIFLDGVEHLCVDVLKNILRINGEDCADDISSIL